MVIALQFYNKKYLYRDFLKVKLPVVSISTKGKEKFEKIFYFSDVCILPLTPLPPPPRPLLSAFG
jgi:hypothetical protein